jgi:hypothetical protein
MQNSNGCTHDKQPGFCFGPAEPTYLTDIPVRERDKRIVMDSDLCIVDGSHFFIRGCLDVPIIGTLAFFRWLVWVSISHATLNRVADLWESPGRENEPAYFGWLDSMLPGYPSTVGLKTNIHTRLAGTRPFIEVEPTNHPLAIEQQRGIPIERANQLANLVLAEWSE